ncbi:hypothetical protein SERLADRAFT_468971 [Serpula lacrymans var. lacrymans S7.9]|uniref:Uncharacterized protein n=1 Tax=Serpula lacrymans var. lacrymans (strain S7.9) TaxID=578457 RepID=F8NW82_SERL9|nr:uncharacterized protein SERLADRAFT_468971 [Serpula lacrymans var. lacrymans S7.9]EGO24962.1 hypothetical protein SERLADRAFT_468971 [Serpula lacrymans var. lacrymans S7.9]
MKVLQSADHSRNVLEPPAVALQPAIEPKFIGTRSTLSDDLFEDVHASVYEDSEVGYNSIASVSVPTNGIPHLVFCTSTSLPAHTSRVAIPSVDKRVFYVCSVRCIGSSLLEGSVRFFVDDVHVAGATLIRNALGYRIDCPLAVDNNVSVGYSCKAEMGCVQFPQTLTNTTFTRTVFSAITICNNYPRPLYGLIIRHALPVSDDLHVQVVLRSPKDVANTEGSAMVNSDVQPDVHARWSSSHEHHSDSGLDWQQNKLLEWVLSTIC